MYVSRLASHRHGAYQVHLLLATIALTLAIAWRAPNPTDYAVIFLSSGLLFTLMEFRIDRLGIRKSELHLSDKALPPLLNCALRGFTEGTGYCVPAFFFADHLARGEDALAWGVLAGFAALWSAYSGLMDLKDVRALPPEERVIVSRRFMTAPRLVMIVAFNASACLAAFFLMSAPWRAHGFAFLFGTFFVAAMFFLINGLLGVRLIERRDEASGEIVRASAPFTVVAFTYDCLFEMAFIFAPFYLIPYALGLFTFKGVL